MDQQDDDWLHIPWPICVAILLGMLVAGFLLGNIYANWGVVCR